MSSEPYSKDPAGGLRPPSISADHPAAVGKDLKTMSSSELPAPPIPSRYYPDNMILYGVKLNERTEASLPFNKDPGGTLRLLLSVTHRSNPLPPADVAIAAVYGYGYEGHCYRLDAPKIMVFLGAIEEPALGCGFETSGPGPGYMMWRIRSRTEILELGMTFGLAEDIVLESNMPGRKVPNTYNNNMQLAHRGGRITRTGGT